MTEPTKKFIIYNHTKVSDYIIFKLITKVIDEGLISNNGKNYCYVVRFGVCTIEMIKTKYGYKVIVLDGK